MFKRDLVISIRESGTLNTPVVIPIVNDSIDITTKSATTSFTKNTLGTPDFTDRTVNTGIQETSIKFTTYIKPYKDVNVKLPEELLHESLFGNITTNATQLCTATTNTYNIKKFDLFMTYDSKITFSLKNAVTASADYVFDIQGIARIKWVISGINYIEDLYIEPFYTIKGVYIRNKFTTAHIDFPSLSSGYDIASTNFSLSIKNTIKFPYVETVTNRFAKPSDTPIIEKRSISAKFALYLKVLTLNMRTDLINTLENNSYLDSTANFTAALGNCAGTDNISISMSNIMIKYPKIKVDDITVLNLDFTAPSALICYKE